MTDIRLTTLDCVFDFLVLRGKIPKDLIRLFTQLRTFSPSKKNHFPVWLWVSIAGTFEFLKQEFSKAKGLKCHKVLLKFLLPLMLLYLVSRCPNYLSFQMLAVPPEWLFTAHTRLAVFHSHCKCCLLGKLLVLCPKAHTDFKAEFGSGYFLLFI